MENNKRRRIVYYTTHGKETYGPQRNGGPEHGAEESKFPAVSVSKENIRPRVPRPPTVAHPRTRQAVDNGSHLAYDRAGLYARKGMFPDIKDENGYAGRRTFKTKKPEELINLNVVVPARAPCIKRDQEGDYKNVEYRVPETSPDQEKLFPQLVYGEDMVVSGKKYNIPTQLPKIVNGLPPHMHTKKRVPTPSPFVNSSVADLRVYMRSAKPVAALSPTMQADISNSSSFQSQTDSSTSDGCTVQIPSQISIITPEPPKTKRPLKSRPVPKGRLPPLSEESMSCRNTCKSKKKH